MNTMCKKKKLKNLGKMLKSDMNNFLWVYRKKKSNYTRIIFCNTIR